MPLDRYSYGPVIFAHSERDDLVIACVTKYSRFTVLIAPGRDGDHATTALESIGCQVIRGSSLRDGLSAMMNLTRALRFDQNPAGFCVDGPLGPRGRVKQGVLYCSQVSGRPIVPIATAARWQIVIPRTWSQTFVPLPFSKVVICAGEEFRVPAHATREDLRGFARQLEIQLAGERERAETAVRRKSESWAEYR